MNLVAKNISNTLLRFFILLILFQTTRLYFLIINFENFSELQFPELFKAFLSGFIFDLSAIAYIEGIIFLLFALPGNLKYNKFYAKFLKTLYIAVNVLLLMSNLADSEYFAFSKKRSTVFILETAVNSNGNSDFLHLLPSYIVDFKFVFLTGAAFGIILYFLFFDATKIQRPKYNLKTFLLESLFFILLMAGIIIASRGGIMNLKPIGIIDASNFQTNKEAPLILNTPFCVIKTIGKKQLERKKYFSNDEIELITKTEKNYTDSTAFAKKNVVIIIVESFSNEFIGLHKKRTYTPFFDSLCKQGLFFEKAYANGTKSVEGLPSVVAGIPSLMENPFISSAYCSDKFDNLPMLLKHKGYHTSFFHGGNNGTMGFDNFAKLMETDEIYQRNEYPDKKDFDGNWGIFDHAFLQFAASKFDSFKQPFFSYIFTLSSHHPFTIPEQYKTKFNQSDEKIFNAISYADFSLKMFFETCKNSDWYRNTLFVITADHSGPSISGDYNSSVDRFGIPILFYCPSDTTIKREITNNTIQQIDIMPSILDYLNYDTVFYALGNSIFAKNENKYAISFQSGIYQIIQDDYILFFNEKETIGLYNFKSDKSLKHDLKSELPDIKQNLENLIKANIQNYNNRMIENILMKIND